MSAKLVQQLEEWLCEGSAAMGEITLSRGAGDFVLRHYLDAGLPDLVRHARAEDAIELAKYDAAGKYRPLRSAPTLRRGWTLHLSNLAEVVRALDFFYPAMLGTAQAFAKNAGCPVHLRETLGRQTGMYRVAAKITDDQADGLIGEVCHQRRCLKSITWQIGSRTPITSLPPEKFDLAADLLKRPDSRPRLLPLPCEEACNILVAAAREAVKKAPSAPPTPA